MIDPALHQKIQKFMEIDQQLKEKLLERQRALDGRRYTTEPTQNKQRTKVANKNSAKLNHSNEKAAESRPEKKINVARPEDGPPKEMLQGLS